MIDSVCTRTPETSVKEFNGPGLCRPIWSLGRISRMRGRCDGRDGREVVILSVEITR